MRFTLAHELGHVIMHPIPTQEMEKQANDFAGALLIPREDVRQYFAGVRRVDIAVLAHLKPQWRVSMAALMHAARDEGFISPGQFQGLWKQFSARRYRLREPPELDFPHEGTTLDKRLIEAHTNELGYSVPELARALVVTENDLIDLYGLPKPKAGLRLVP
jgi:Zn-dependent peptidase ImmA (M78 family)